MKTIPLLDFLTSVHRTDMDLKEVYSILREIKKTDILVGVPQEASGRKGEVTNAELVYIHTNGSAVRKIPARPIIEPAIEDGKDELALLLKDAVSKALEVNREGAMAGLEKVGMQGQNITRAWFTNPKNHWAPNADSTIKIKGSDRPLIDTAEMRKSITYVVRKK